MTEIDLSSLNKLIAAGRWQTVIIVLDSLYDSATQGRVIWDASDFDLYSGLINKYLEKLNAEDRGKLVDRVSFMSTANRVVKYDKRMEDGRLSVSRDIMYSLADALNDHSPPHIEYAKQGLTPGVNDLMPKNFKDALYITNVLLALKERGILNTLNSRRLDSIVGLYENSNNLYSDLTANE